MKKSTLESVINYLNGDTSVDVAELRNTLVAEYNHLNEKALANADLYASARETVLDALTDTPITVADLFNKIEADLPEGFSRGKVQYGLLHQWREDVTVTEMPKSANMYSRKA